MSEDSRQSIWTCRVPVEVFTRILLIIAFDEQSAPFAIDAADTASSDTSSDITDSTSDIIPFIPSPASTLSRIQSTSSALYLSTTPFLYRHLRLTTLQLILLLELFGGIDNTHEVIYKTPDGGRHPLDLGLYHRLRWALSFVETIDLTWDTSYDRRLYHHVTDYANISTVLQVMKLPTLWPKLNQVTIKVRERALTDEGLSECFMFPYESRLMSLIGPTLLRPTHLHIDLPDLQSGTQCHAPYFADWVDRPTALLQSMSADHVTVTNLYEIGQGVPRAKKSLEINFAARAGATIGYIYPDYSWGLLRGKLEMLANFAHGVPNLTVVGFERGMAEIGVETLEWYLQKELTNLADGRDEFRYRIKPWTSSEPGDWDVWHSVDEEFGRQWVPNNCSAAQADNKFPASGSRAPAFRLGE